MSCSKVRSPDKSHTGAVVLSNEKVIRPEGAWARQRCIGKIRIPAMAKRRLVNVVIMVCQMSGFNAGENVGAVPVRQANGSRFPSLLTGLGRRTHPGIGRGPGDLLQRLLRFSGSR